MYNGIYYLIVTVWYIVQHNFGQSCVLNLIADDNCSLAAEVLKMMNVLL